MTMPDSGSDTETMGGKGALEAVLRPLKRFPAS